MARQRVVDAEIRDVAELAGVYQKSFTIPRLGGEAVGSALRVLLDARFRLVGGVVLDGSEDRVTVGDALKMPEVCKAAVLPNVVVGPHFMPSQRQGEYDYAPNGVGVWQRPAED